MKKPSHPADKSLPADKAPESRRRRQLQVSESFQVVVECASEADQQAVYEQMKRAGRRCRLLTM